MFRPRKKTDPDYQTQALAFIANHYEVGPELPAIFVLSEDGLRATTDLHCMLCGWTEPTTVSADAFQAWRAGAPVGIAFPELSTELQELLITQCHPICLDGALRTEVEQRRQALLETHAGSTPD